MKTQKKEKKVSPVKKPLAYGGSHSKLTYLGMLLSGISAVVVLFTVVYIWMTAKAVMLAYPMIMGASRDPITVGRKVGHMNRSAIPVHLIALEKDAVLTISAVLC